MLFYSFLRNFIFYSFICFFFLINKKILSIYHLPQEVSVQNVFDVFGRILAFLIELFKFELIFLVNTYVLNVSEYIRRLCDINLPSYSLMDCRKVNSDEQRLLRYLMR